VAGPLRFRRSPQRWPEQRIRQRLLAPLDRQFGATLSPSWYKLHGPYESYRLEMDNGDLVLFAAGDDEAFWLGNTETPEVLWRTNKHTFEEAPDAVTEWAERELLAQLREQDPWLAAHESLARYFLPVFFSKDGRETTRRFFREHAAGFPDADRETALAFYDDFLSTGVLDAHRYTMAAKLGTSERLEPDRMASTMTEFNAAKLLADAGHAFEPEAELDSGYALDFRVGDTLVEVTRPKPPRRRNAATAAGAIRDTVDTKTGGQLDAHEGALLLVDASSFRDDEWNAVRAERPDPGYRPAVVFRVRPDGTVEGYRHGSTPLALDGAITWV
jgi:hypothetical protein